MKKMAWKLFRLIPLNLRRRILFAKNQRRVLRLNSPETFNEKVNWRIVNDRREILSWTCDKLQMKHYAVELSPGLLVPKTLWAGKDLGELCGFVFPERWILKANHRSQCVYIGKGTPQIHDLIRATEGWLDRVQEIDLGEWAYSMAEPLLLLEEWIGDLDVVPEDYKLFAFNGRVEMIQVDTDRFIEHKIALYDRDWQRMVASKGLWLESQDLVKPAALDQMIAVAEEISNQYDFMRIDLFSTSSGIYFGETTPYPGGGLSPFDPMEFDRILGNLWVLPSLGSVD